MPVAQPGVIQAAQRLALQKPEGLEVTLNQFAHLEHILTHDAHNVPVLEIINLKSQKTLHRDKYCLWMKAN